MPLPKQHEVDIWNRALSRIGDARIIRGADVAVTSVTAAAPPVVTSAVHSLAVGDRVLLFDMTGAAEMNGRVFLVGTVPLTTTLTLYREDGSTLYTAGTGGFLSKLPDVETVRACFDAWPEVRDEMLRAHPWNSIVRRGRLARLQASKTITDITEANPAVVTSAAHGYEDGDLVLIENVVGMTEVNGRYFTVADADTNTFALSGEDASDYTAYGSAGTAKKALPPFKPDFGYGYRYTLPDDCERVLELAEDPQELWELEGRELHCNIGPTVPMRFAKRISDPDLWDAQLVNVMAARLAYEIAEELSASTKLRDLARSDFEAMLAEAKREDSQEQAPQDFAEDDWVLAHSQGTGVPLPGCTPRGTR
jgi:hypothetical protein